MWLSLKAVICLQHALSFPLEKEMISLIENLAKIFQYKLNVYKAITR